MSHDDIIQARMERPFTRIGLANTLREHNPEMSHKTAEMIADKEIKKAAKEGRIKFTRESGVAVWRKQA